MNPLSPHLEKVLIAVIAVTFLFLGIYVSGVSHGKSTVVGEYAAAQAKTQNEHEKIKKKIMHKSDADVDRDLSQWMRD